MKKEPLKVKCPTCRKVGYWFTSAYGPFCSRRCKLVDLGRWFNEENKVSEPLPPGGAEESEVPSTDHPSPPRPEQD